MIETTAITLDEPDVVVFLGMTHRLLATAAQTDGSVSLVEINVPPGGGAPLHTNTREALSWYVVDGTLTFLQAGRDPSEVGAGSAIFLPREQGHAFVNRTDQPATA